jgi:hypothetical protein
MGLFFDYLLVSWKFHESDSNVEFSNNRDNIWGIGAKRQSSKGTKQEEKPQRSGHQPSVSRSGSEGCVMIVAQATSPAGISW